MTILTVQQKLRTAGFDPGPLDGLWGRRTEQALDEALKAALSVRPLAAGNADAVSIAMALIKKWEGLKLTAYPDPATGGAPWTIGYGSTGPGIVKGVTWTQAQADERLRADVRKFMDGVLAALRAPVHPHELGAMTSLAYNIGGKEFANSTLVRRFNEGNRPAAAAQFDVWRMANGKVMQGLVNRRKDERAVFEGSQV